MTPSAVSAPLAPAGQLIGLTAYNPVATDKAITSTTSADVPSESSNLKVDFIVPASGKIVVRLTCGAYNGASEVLSWVLREGSTDVTPIVNVLQGSGGLPWASISRTFSITGLIPGSSKTYKWGAIVSSGTAHMRYGDVYGQATMEVYDAAISLPSVPPFHGQMIGLASTTTGGSVITATGSYSDVHAGAQASFIAPASGMVLYRVDIGYQDLTVTATSATGDAYYATLNDGTTDLATDRYINRILVGGSTVGGSGTEGPTTITWLITGLTPGISYTYKLRHKVTDISHLSGRMGGTNGIIISVYDASISPVGISSGPIFVDYTPVVAQNGTRTISGVVARYTQIGKLVRVIGQATITNAGTAGNTITVSLPIPAAAGIIGLMIGMGYYYDASPSNQYIGSAVLLNSTTIEFLSQAAGGNAIGSTPNIATANGDQIQWEVLYEAA